MRDAGVPFQYEIILRAAASCDAFRCIRREAQNRAGRRLPTIRSSTASLAPVSTASRILATSKATGYATFAALWCEACRQTSQTPRYRRMPVRRRRRRVRASHVWITRMPAASLVSRSAMNSGEKPVSAPLRTIAKISRPRVVSIIGISSRILSPSSLGSIFWIVAARLCCSTRVDAVAVPVKRPSFKAFVEPRRDIAVAHQNAVQNSLSFAAWDRLGFQAAHI